MIKLHNIKLIILGFLICFVFLNFHSFSQRIGRFISPKKTFINVTKERPLRENFNIAFQIFSKEFDEKKASRQLMAADLGAGAGNETIYLIEKEWNVIAIDTNPYSIKTIRERFQELQRKDRSENKQKLGSLDARLISMQKMELKPNSLDLVNASLSLPYIPRTQMKDVWKKIVDALKVGGVFTGDFFGPEHAWRNNPTMSFYSLKEILKEFFDDSNLEIRYVFDKREESRLAAGGTVFFHTITIIAQKK